MPAHLSRHVEPPVLAVRRPGRVRRHAVGDVGKVSRRPRRDRTTHQTVARGNLRAAIIEREGTLICQELSKRPCVKSMGPWPAADCPATTTACGPWPKRLVTRPTSWPPFRPKPTWDS